MEFTMTGQPKRGIWHRDEGVSDEWREMRVDRMDDGGWQWTVCMSGDEGGLDGWRKMTMDRMYVGGPSAQGIYT